jgi:hypothetical protein
MKIGCGAPSFMSRHWVTLSGGILYLLEYEELRVRVQRASYSPSTLALVKNVEGEASWREGMNHQLSRTCRKVEGLH